MSKSHLLKRLLLASAAVGAAACGARTGDEVDEPRELLRAQAAAGAAGSAHGGASQAGASQGGKGGAGGSKTIIPGCGAGATCIESSWCETEPSNDVCECVAGHFSCGKPFPWGKTTKVCFQPAPGAACPQLGTGALNAALPWTLGCVPVSVGPDLEHLGGDPAYPTCCYQVSNFACGGRPLVVSELAWTARLVARRDWT